MLFLRLAFRDLVSRKTLSLLLITNLIIALAGLILIESLERSLRDELAGRSKELLGADLSISGRRDLTPEERKDFESLLPPSSRVGLVRETYSMVSSKTRSRLVNIRAVFSGYPYYGSGSVSLKEENSVPLRGENLPGGQIWIYPELLSQLSVEIDDFVTIGQMQFKIQGIVSKDLPSSGIRAMFAPGLYLHPEDLDKTGLIRKGSLITYRYLVQLPDFSNLEGVLENVESKIDDPGLRIRGPEDASERTTRLARYVNDFLGLVVVIAILLSAIATAFLYRTYLNQKLKDIAILSSLGASSRFIRHLLLAELSILVLLAGSIATAFSFLVLPLFKESVSSLVSLDFSLSLHPTSILLSFLVGYLSVFLVTLPTLLTLGKNRPSFLFQEAAQPQLRFEAASIAAYLPFFFFILGVAIWQSNSWKVGTIFVLSLSGISISLAFLGKFLLRTMEKFKEPNSFPVRLALRHLRRSPFSTVIGFLALCLAVTLASTVPQVEKALQKDLSIAAEEKLPDFFLFDIQEEDIPSLQSKLATLGTELEDLSPLVRARLLRKNGEIFEKLERKDVQTREEERESRFRNRGFNLSSRPELFESEELVAGRPFSGRYEYAIGSDQLVELSIEKGFAEDLGFELEDHLTFLVEGVEIEGRVINLREVRWSSFQPNFFVLLQPGVLDPAPKSFLGTLRVGENGPDEIQSAIVETAPNVSMIDVRRTISTILDFSEKISQAIAFMAILTALSGFIVFLSILAFQIFRRRWDIALLKVMSPSFEMIQRSLLWESFFIAFFACGIGFFLSYGISASLGFFIFDLRAWPPLYIPLFISLLALGSALIGTLLLVRGQLRKSPASILGGKDLIAGI